MGGIYTPSKRMNREFAEDKKSVIATLFSLKEGLEFCTSLGFLDPDEKLYNRLLDLLESAHAADLPLELTELIEEAKEMELLLETWLEKEGRSSLSLEWPRIRSS
jgi:hypothetical protein